MKSAIIIPSILSLLCSLVWAQPQMLLEPETDSQTPETHTLRWGTTPEIRYQLEEATSLELQDWSPVSGFPSEASARAQAHSFALGNDAQKFYRVLELDEDAPAIATRTPRDGAFGIGRFSDLTIDLDDPAGVNPASISMTVGTHGPFDLSSDELTLAAGDILTFDLGGDTAIGGYGEEITASLTVSDGKGNSDIYVWTFELEIEPEIAPNVFVFGSPDAQRAGQKLEGASAQIASRFYQGPIRMNGGASDWQIESVTDTTVVISYTGASAPQFTVDDLITNLAPNHLDEIFYRRVTSVSDDTTNKRLTLGTTEAILPEFLVQGSFNITENAYFFELDENGNIIRAIEFDATFPLPSIGKDFLEDVPEGENLVLWTDGPLELSLAEAKVLFTPSLKVNLETGSGAVQRFEAQAIGDIEIACYPVLTVSGAYAPDLDPIELWSYSHVIWTAVGYIPVAIELKASVNATAEIGINAAATLTTGFRQNVNMGVAGVYEKDATPTVSWDRWFTPEPTVFEPLSYTITGNADAVLALVPQIDVRVYAAAGVYVNTNPRVEIHGSATFTDGELTEASWLLGAYADVNAGLSVIGFENDELPALPPFRLFTKEWGDEYTSGPVGSLQINRQPISQNARLGDTVVFSVEATGDGSLEYTWFQNDTELLESGSSLTITNVKAADEGDYYVQISDGGTPITSETAALDIITSVNTGPAPKGFVRIPAGSYMMGDAFDEGIYSETPVHSVSVSAFYIARTEVTLEHWQSVFDWAVTNGYSFDNTGSGKAAKHPVQSISWYDAVKWCNAASEREGLAPVYRTSGGGVFRTGQLAPVIVYDNNGYRLPTEAEWEKAARGGLSGKRYPWGNSISHQQANYVEETIEYGPLGNIRRIVETYHPYYDDGEKPYTSPVGSFSPNAYGLYDMAGNVRELCNDFFSNDYYSDSPTIDPRGPSAGNGRRVERGGSWANNADFCRLAYRHNGMTPNYYYYVIGFRLARNAD